MRKASYVCAILFTFTIPMEKAIVLPVVGSLGRILGLLTAAVWLLSLISRGRIRRLTAFHITFFLFVLWNAASYLWSLDGERTFGRISTWFQLAVLVTIVWDVLRTNPQLRVAMQAYVLGACLAVGSAIHNYLNEITFVYGRYSAMGFHGGSLGLIVAFGIPMAWYLTFAKSDDSSLVSRLRPINIAYLPVAFAGIALTGSRGAMLAALPSLLFVLGTFGRLKPRMRVLFLLVTLVGLYHAHQLILPAASYERLGTTYSELTGGGDLTGRVGLWKAAADMFAEHPLFGVGSGAFKTSVDLGQEAHNAFLSVLVELGIVGLLLFSTVLLIVLYDALRMPRLEAFLAVSLLASWFIGASAIAYEYHKPTWLLFSFVLIAARYHASCDLGSAEIERSGIRSVRVS